MSKLFDTLEKIRENEGAAPARNSAGIYSVNEAQEKPKKPLIFFLLPAVVACGIYLFLPRFIPQATNTMSRQTTFSSSAVVVREKKVSHPQDSYHQAAAVRQVALGQSGNGESLGFVHLNGLGVEAVQKNQYWRGIYYLQKAAAVAPQRIEPLVNLGVAFAELGLYPRAIDCFEKALKINPAYVPLRKNLRILYNANLLPGEIFSARGFKGRLGPDFNEDNLSGKNSKNPR